MLELTFLLVFAISLCASLASMPLLIRYSGVLKLVDNPSTSERKLHKTKMPRSGGIGIIFATSVALLLVLPIEEQTLSFVLASLIIIVFGLIDDIIELTPAQKLAGQALGIAVAMAGGMVIADVPLLGSCPAWFSYSLTLVFVLGVINGVNFSDGMDGLAAGIALMSLVLVFVLAIDAGDMRIALMSLTICAALIGFLRFNTHPARIFMGDSGSQFLGFSLAWLCISISQGEAAAYTSFLPLLVLGLAVLDIVQVIPVRLKKRLPLPGPDKEHLHHQIAKFGFYQYEVVAIIYVLQTILLTGAYFLRTSTDFQVATYFAGYSVVILGAIYLAHLYGWRMREITPDGHSQRNPLFRSLGVLHPYSGKFYGIIVSLVLVSSSLLSSNVEVHVIYMGLTAGVVILLLRLVFRGGWQLLLSRLATYSAAVFATYGLGVSIDHPGLNIAINTFLVALAVCLAVSMRTTRKEYFWLTPQDLLLVIFVILLAPFVSMRLDNVLNEGEMIFRAMVLLYACEYVIARGVKAQSRISYAAVASLLLLALGL